MGIATTALPFPDTSCCDVALLRLISGSTSLLAPGYVEMVEKTSIWSAAFMNFATGE
jgi:hypothetical protein